MKGIIYKSSLFLVSLAKQIVPVISSDKVEIYSESFRRSANKPNYRPADEASLIQDDIYVQLFGTRLIPVAEQRDWQSFGQNILGTSNRGELGHAISLSYDGKFMAVCGSVHAFLYRMHGGQWVLVKDFSDDLDPGRGFFSISLSSDSTRLAIGASNNDEQGFDSGYVKIYEQQSKLTWKQIGQTLHGDSGDLFGHSLALSADGTRLIIGAFGGGYVDVFEFKRSTQRWISNQSFQGSAADGFGFSVAISGLGDRVLIGAPWGSGDTGFIRLYDILNYEFVVEFDGRYFGDQFGFSVSFSLDGNRVASGAYGASYVRIFEYSEDKNQWAKLGIDISYDDGHYALGESISLSEFGDMIAVGAPWGDLGGPLSGIADLYEYVDNEWTKVGPTLSGGSINDLLGKSVSISANGKRLAIGCPGCDSSGYNAGKAKIFEVPGATSFDDDDSAPSISPSPSLAPSLIPTRSSIPTTAPSILSSLYPSRSPSNKPSSTPTTTPTIYSTKTPSITPSTSPSQIPSLSPIKTSIPPSLRTNMKVFIEDDDFIDMDDTDDFTTKSFRRVFFFFRRIASFPIIIGVFVQKMRSLVWWWMY